MLSRDSSLLKQHFNARIFKSYFDYIRDHYPDLDVRIICEKAGLDYEFLQNENNWVSCVFNLRLMKSLSDSIRDPQFHYKVGSYSVSKEGLGPALYNLGKNVFDVDYIYGNLWRLSSYLNKVIKFDCLQRSKQSVVLNATPILDGLDEYEAQSLKQLLPFVIQNTAGYYAALPRLKGLNDAVVDIHEKGDLFEFRIKFPTENFRRLEALLALLGSTILSASVEYIWESWAWALTAFVTCLGLYGIVFSRRAILNLKSTAMDLETNIDLVNDQYKRLQITQEELDRRYLEAKALNAVSNHLVASSDENLVMENICKDLSEILSFDRVLIFLKDDLAHKLAFRAGYVGPIAARKLFGNLKFDIEIPSDDPTKIANVFRARQPILIKNVKEHLQSLNEESRIALQASGSQSFIAVPIFSDDENFGVLLADNYVSSRRLSEADLGILTTVAQQAGIVLQKVRAQSSLEVAYSEIERLAASYSRFVPFKLIDLIGFQTVLDVNLKAGREYEMAIVFSDIRGFTSMSEAMPPSESVAFLNSYFSSLAPVFEQYGGIIDKFLGDGIMALFLDPESAVQAAVEFQKRLVIYNQVNRSGNKRSFISAGVGIHFGKVLLGAVGYEDRMSISVTSDSVNLASRVDGLNKQFGVDMLCSSELVDKLAQRDGVRFVGRIQVKGRQSLTDIYEILGHLDRDTRLQREAAEPVIRRCVDLLDKGLVEEALFEVETAVKQFAADPVIAYYRKEIEFRNVGRTGKASAA